MKIRLHWWMWLAPMVSTAQYSTDTREDKMVEVPNTVLGTLSWEQEKAASSAFLYIHPKATVWNQPLHSHNIPLVVFATAIQLPNEPLALLLKERRPLHTYVSTYLPSSTTQWYVGDQLFRANNSAFFGIEFDSSFAYRGGVVHIGDSSERAVSILVSLYPPPE